MALSHRREGGETRASCNLLHIAMMYGDKELVLAMEEWHGGWVVDFDRQVALSLVSKLIRLSCLCLCACVYQRHVI